MGIIAKLRALSGIGIHGWARLGHTAAVARRIERSLKTDPLDVTARRFGATLSGDRPVTTGDLAISSREAEDIDLALRLLRRSPFNSTCLRRALVISDILRDRKPVLRVGVSKNEGVVAAHAWVEIDGTSLDPMAEQEYVVLGVPRVNGA